MSSPSSKSAPSASSKHTEPPTPTAIIPISALSFTASLLFTVTWVAAVVATILMRDKAESRGSPFPLPAVSDVSRFPDAHPFYVMALTMSGFLISQLSLFLRISQTFPRHWQGKLANYVLIGLSIGGLLLTIGSGIFITAVSHAVFLGIGTVLIWAWMFVMSHLLKGRWIWVSLLRLAMLCTIVGFAFTLRSAATKGAVLLAVGEYLILIGISLFLFGLGGYLWGIQVRIRIDILGEYGGKLVENANTFMGVNRAEDVYLTTRVEL